MATHTVAFFTEPFGASVPTALNAVDDQVLAKVTATGLVPTRDLMIVAALAASSNQLAARIASPSLAQVALPWIRPTAVVSGGLEPDTPMQPMVDAPLPIRAGERLEIQAIAAGPTGVGAFLWLTERIEPVPRGPAVTVRFTGEATGEHFTWVRVAITLAEQLPKGRYAVIGAEGSFPDAVIARLVFPGAVYRAGFPCYDSFASMQPDVFRNRLLGVFGYFQAFAPPSLEVMSGDVMSGAAVEGFLTVVKVG